MRGRATGRLCVVIRGVVSDAASRLFNGVICDLPFKTICSPIEDYQHYSTFLLDLSTLPRGIFVSGWLCECSNLKFGDGRQRRTKRDSPPTDVSR